MSSVLLSMLVAAVCLSCAKSREICGCCLMQRDSTQKYVKSLDIVLGADYILILDDTKGPDMQPT